MLLPAKYTAAGLPAARLRLKGIPTGSRGRAGARCATIIGVARKIPENLLYEDPKLLRWYDQALARTGEE